MSIMDNYVDKSSNQSISGVKTITGDGWNLYMQSNSILYNTAPSSWINKAIGFTFQNKSTTNCQIHSPAAISTNWLAIGYWY